jgi:transcription initiation factor TFIIIB Brf1 subunit/transcription initiation factor TFIIB
MVSYSLVEDWAFRHFVDKAKDHSTLRAKCRSIWNWYDNRDWSIPNSRERKTKTQGELMATRSEHMKAINEQKLRETRAKIKGAIERLKFMNEKPSVRKIAEYAGVSKTTVQKHYKEFL